MTQLELPPISFARYLELLKRRRWQVIPMTLVGLLIGLIAALLIPRYYVAEAMLTYQGLVLDPDARTQEDPLFATVSSAVYSIPNTVPDALEKLEWIGKDDTDPARDSTIDAVKSRLEVQEHQPEKGQSHYYIQLKYKDVDGAKAAQFVNTLQEVWRSSIELSFENAARDELEKEREHGRSLEKARENALKELQIHAQLNPVNPFAENGTEAETSLYNELRTEQTEEARLEGETEALRKKIDGLQILLDENVIREQVETKVPVAADPEVAALQKEVLRWDVALHTCAPTHPDYQTFRHNYQAAVELLKAKVPGGISGGEAAKLVDNPKFKETKEEISTSKAEFAAKEKQLAIIQARIAKLEAERKALPGIWSKYQELKLKLDDAQSALDHQREVERAKMERYEKARTGDPFVVSAASVPPAPTDPNITLVALAGCVIGLGAAIGLVLLLDFMRSTFKTVDDVGFAVSVPVLGMMAYLETSEERTRLHRNRRKVSIAAASFLALSLSLVTVYYVAPTRLPTVVLHALDLILGSTR